MTTKVQKWGNSLAPRLPKEMAEKMHIGQGTEVTLMPTKDGILLKSQTKKPTLDDLLDNITPENRHDNVDFGQEGNELF
jgi:antitoxin MazE